MGRYFLRRLLQAVVVLWLLTVIVFAIARLSGNPVDLLLPQGAPPSQRVALIHQFGLDQPWPVQYAKFLGHALEGDFGESVRFHTSAISLVLSHVPATFELAMAALLIAVVVGIPLGIIAALFRGRAVDYGTTTVLTLGQAMPSFWLAILLILWLGVDLRWLPVGGRSGIESLIMPAVTLSIVPLVTIARITRSSISSVLPQDYVRTAEAKGLRRRTVLVRHVLRNGLIPVVTVTGIAMGQLLSGAVITEQIFTWPGVGWLSIQAIEARDYAVVQSVTLVVATIIVALNLLVDFMYFALDPRIRESQATMA
jgi:ABC-type dipeptide/oligopeptide/nickel transport system permease component